MFFCSIEKKFETLEERHSESDMEFIVAKLLNITMVNKVRYVARSIYERTSQVISLNVVYLLMFSSDNTKHVCAIDREKERERERACNNERGVPESKLRASESHCYVMYMCTNRASKILSINMNISVYIKNITCLLQY